VGRITALDDARVNETLVNHGALYAQTDVGKLSSEVVAARLREANRFTQAEWSAQPMTCADDVEAAVREANLAVLCLDKPAASIWDWMNEACLKRKVLWTSAHIEDFAGMVGPSVVPFQTPCYKCYDLRRKSNLDADDFEEAMAWEQLLRERGGRLDFTTGTLPAFAPLLGAVTAIEALKLLTGFEKPTALGAVWEIDFPTLKVVVRPLLKVPRCPACGGRQHAASH
jgi:thiazole/oxazole-forming peptide maturase SagC family component